MAGGIGNYWEIFRWPSGYLSSISADAGKVSAYNTEFVLAQENGKSVQSLRLRWIPGNPSQILAMKQHQSTPFINPDQNVSSGSDIQLKRKDFRRKSLPPLNYHYITFLAARHTT